MTVCETATAHFDHIVEGHSDLDLQLTDPKIHRGHLHSMGGMS